MMPPSSTSRASRAGWTRVVRSRAIPIPRTQSSRSSRATMLAGAGASGASRSQAKRDRRTAGSVTSRPANHTIFPMERGPVAVQEARAGQHVAAYRQGAQVDAQPCRPAQDGVVGPFVADIDSQTTTNKEHLGTGKRFERGLRVEGQAVGGMHRAVADPRQPQSEGLAANQPVERSQRLDGARQAHHGEPSSSRKTVVAWPVFWDMRLPEVRRRRQQDSAMPTHRKQHPGRSPDAQCRVLSDLPPTRVSGSGPMIDVERVQASLANRRSGSACLKPCTWIRCCTRRTSSRLRSGMVVRLQRLGDLATRRLHHVRRRTRPCRRAPRPGRTSPRLPQQLPPSRIAHLPGGEGSRAAADLSLPPMGLRLGRQPATCPADAR